MESMLKTSLWNQFGAAIDMLDDSIRLCPDTLWTAALWKDPDDARTGEFWFIAYHAVFWLDLYLTGSSQGFTPPAPFLRKGLPESPYTKEQVRAYLEHCRQRCQATIEALTDEKAQQPCTFKWITTNFLELQLYSMRHVQEHTAQLNLLLGQHGVSVVDWVTQARSRTA